VISYDGKIHFYNISLMSKSHLFFFTWYLCLFNRCFCCDNNDWINFRLIKIHGVFYLYCIDYFIDTTKSMFEVNYRLEPVDLLLDKDLGVGSITDNSTLHDLTNMVSRI
jgi:hypothetical protein